MYYGMILLAVVMFGGCFAINDIYQKRQGSSLKVSLQFCLISSLPGFLFLWILCIYSQLFFNLFGIDIITPNTIIPHQMSISFPQPIDKTAFANMMFAAAAAA